SNRPSGFGARSHVWPLSRCVCTSTKHGQSWPRLRSTLASGPTGVPAATTAAIRPSRIATSTVASPSALTPAPSGRAVSTAAGTVALRSQYASRSGTVTNPAGTISALTLDGALVRAPQDEVRQRRQRKEDQNTAARDHQQGSEHPRDLHRVPRLENAIRETRLRAARPGDELRDHGADQREPAADTQAA